MVINSFWCTTVLCPWSIIVWHFLADLFFILKDVDIASYAYENTPCVTADDINDVIASLCMNLPKRCMAWNVFCNLQFNYCPLIWMFHNSTTDRKMNRFHERCLSIMYNDKQSSFKIILERDSSVSIHERNIQCLALKCIK